MLKFFTLKPQSKEQLMYLPHLWNTVWRKRSRLEHMQAVNRTSRRIGFSSAWSGSGLWSLLKYSREKEKNLKTIAVDVLLKDFPMIPLSCRSNLAGRSGFIGFSATRERGGAGGGRESPGAQQIHPHTCQVYRGGSFSQKIESANPAQLS